ncbi:hypothetical protein QF032_006956 [Streptomyces achromogenes]|uniref:Lipoprotein n=1 Tax=Streptomyces achromogenes TaxID=67255 RepID=A0ABU0QDR2_STRAH|nr:hypothetical protein [Streptomyces achromogenes]MDQ0687913.1 hypothetical protein [Streptomyces achromogenes]MDQ0835112.1 hypothetical protein [Streptomyces achromogenes]
MTNEETMHTNPTRLRRGALTACAAVLALLTAGCSKASETTQTGGCRADDGWSGRQKAAWLRGAVSFRTVEGTAASDARTSVVVGAPRSADARRLCRPLDVQVEFWTLTTTTATTRTESSSVRRYHLFADGGRTRTVGFPGDLPAGRDGVCVGVLAAVYAGEPLTERELPRVTPGPSADEHTPVRFATDRVGAYRLFPPPDPARCAPSRPNAGPPPTGEPGWDPFHP